MLERDTTLVMQTFFDLAMTDAMQGVHGFSIPYRPMELHYVTDTNIQIWESEQGEKWYLDRLLEENLKGMAFMNSVMERYRPILAEIKTYWDKGALTDKEEIKKYFELVRRGISYMSTCFYVGLDDRTPEAVQKLVVAMREGDELFAHGDEFVRDCFTALGRNRELAYLVLPEEFLDTLPTDEELQRRSRGAVLVDGKEFVVSTLKEFAKRHPEFELRDLQTSAPMTTEVKGQIAFKGKVSGLVRIVKNRKQALEVNAGDIIVSPMTTPDFIDAMKKAAAFVTDEGGITCHAAIVAREMKKPCIIGTKIATQVLHDGDMVEVDADNGVVRILK
ncbi:MAG: PEP-utilizing enzyme [bacterium]|nr:PEP-utilizing enzyme [bacterium]